MLGCTTDFFQRIEYISHITNAIGHFPILYNQLHPKEGCIVITGLQAQMCTNIAIETQ